jgi:hypothetical protein
MAIEPLEQLAKPKSKLASRLTLPFFEPAYLLATMLGTEAALVMKGSYNLYAIATHKPLIKSEKEGKKYTIIDFFNEIHNSYIDMHKKMF